jgi:hypothetical protein
MKNLVSSNRNRTTTRSCPWWVLWLFVVGCAGTGDGGTRGQPGDGTPAPPTDGTGGGQQGDQLDDPAEQPSPSWLVIVGLMDSYHLKGATLDDVYLESSNAVVAVQTSTPSCSFGDTSCSKIGDCYRPAPVCTPKCDIKNGESCVWDTGCTRGKCVRVVPHCAACSSDQRCVWDSDCKTGRCVDPPQGLEAGTIEVTGAQQSPVRCEPGDDGSYACDIDSLKSFWGGGEELQVTATGGSNVSPFSLSIAAPRKLKLGITIDDIRQRKDIDLDWSASGPDGDVQLILQSYDESYEFKSVICYSDTKTMHIPKEVFDHMHADGPKIKWAYNAWLTNYKEKTSDDLAIRVQTRNNMTGHLNLDTP